MWTAKNRRQYDRSKLRYPSDLTDDEWAYVGPLIPPAKRGGNKRRVDVREVMNGRSKLCKQRLRRIMYILSTGCQWRAIPKDLPPRSTLFDYLDLWGYDGTLDRIHHALYVACREQAEREASPTAAIIDSHPSASSDVGVKSAETLRQAQEGACIDPHGYDAGNPSMNSGEQGQEAPSSRRYAGFAAPCHRSSRRHPGSRRRHPASCDPVRDVSVLEKAVCRRWLSGARIPQRLGENPAPSRN